jgi:TRAP-type mannitol/chloroaromatic compound transport system permease small subunit
MKNTTAENRGLSDLQFHYTAIQQQLKIALISICLFTLPFVFLLNLLAGVCYGR